MEYTLGSRINRLRKGLGISAAALAQKVGVSEDAIRKIESGRSKQPSFGAGVEIARALGVSPLILLEGPRAAESSVSGDALARAIRALRSVRSELEDLGIKHAGIFGSVARGEEHTQSDIDILIDVDPTVPFSLLTHARAGNVCEDAIGRKVDVMLERSARSQRFDQILEDVIYAF